MLTLKSVAKSFGKNKVLNGVNLHVPPKECLCIVGEGGSGKSTLLKLLIRADDPTAGSVEVDGVNLKAVPAPILQLFRRRLGVIFQEPMLLLHATVAENIALPLELYGAPVSVINRNVNDLLKRMKLTDKANTLAENLSMSERCMVAIARAIITAPMIMIADEPLMHLDPAQAKVVTELLLNMHKKGTTLIIFSRDEDTAKEFGAKVIVLNDGVISGQVAPKKMTKTSEHRILEEDEKPLSSFKEEPRKEDDGSSKKVKITSIGSGLQ